jgi:hypothetical protein
MFCLLDACKPVETPAKRPNTEIAIVPGSAKKAEDVPAPLAKRQRTDKNKLFDEREQLTAQCKFSIAQYTEQLKDIRSRPLLYDFHITQGEIRYHRKLNAEVLSDCIVIKTDNLRLPRLTVRDAIAVAEKLEPQHAIPALQQILRNIQQNIAYRGNLLHRLRKIDNSWKVLCDRAKLVAKDTTVLPLNLPHMKEAGVVSMMRVRPDITHIMGFQLVEHILQDFELYCK